MKIVSKVRHMGERLYIPIPKEDEEKFSDITDIDVVVDVTVVI